MKQNEKDESSLQAELEGWLKLQQEPDGLKYLYNVLNKHCLWCNKQALRLLKNKEDRNADCMRGKAEVIGKVVVLIQERINEVKMTLMKGGE